MSDIRIGSLFTGYGGLDMAVEHVTGGRTVWTSDVCKFNADGSVGHYDPHRGACAIIQHRYPGVPNLGDISSVDWSSVEPIEVLTGGFPLHRRVARRQTARHDAGHPVRVVVTDGLCNRPTTAAARRRGKRERTAQCRRN